MQINSSWRLTQCFSTPPRRLGRAMLANLLRERVPERLNGTFCQLIVRIHSDSLHPNNSGRVLIADYLRAYLLEALLQLHREAQMVATGAIVSPNAAVAALPHETVRVGLQPMAMRCYGFLGEHGASIYLPPKTCVRSLARLLTLSITLPHPPWYLSTELPISITDSVLATCSLNRSPAPPL